MSYKSNVHFLAQALVSIISATGDYMHTGIAYFPGANWQA
jgi:hypothetical protein